MTIQETVFWYAAIICGLLVALVWMLLKGKAEKTKKAENAANTEAARDRPAAKRINWSAVRAYRLQNLLTGEMWFKVLLAAFIALCAAVIVVVFVFPLGAGWAAVATFVAVAVIVGVLVGLMD